MESARPDRLFHDELAELFVAAAVADIDDDHLLGWILRGQTLADVVPSIRGYLALRTRYFDDQAIAAGCPQVVIVGAGLDARAYRLTWPTTTVVFEIDTADVTAFKTGVLAGVDHRPSCRRIAIAADLREDWSTPLAAAGFDRETATLWLAEGLLPYLDDAGTSRLMTTIAALSAPGSGIVLDHAYPAARTTEDNAAGRARGVLFGSVVADPLVWLGRFGWRAELADPVDLAARLHRDLPPLLDPARPGAPSFWLATATRQAG